MINRICLQLPLMLSFILLVSITNPIPAALPSDSVDALKKNASEKLQIEIMKVEELPQKRSAKGYHKLLYTAKVTKVDQTKTGVKVGTQITIDAYHWTVDFVGPANPPLLKKGWKGGIYLNAVDVKNSFYKLAAYGHSFY